MCTISSPRCVLKSNILIYILHREFMYNVFKVYVKEDEVLTSLPAPLQVWQVSCFSTCEIIANPYSTDFLIVHGDKSLFECIGVALN